MIRAVESIDNITVVLAEGKVLFGNVLVIGGGRICSSRIVLAVAPTLVLERIGWRVFLFEYRLGKIIRHILSYSAEADLWISLDLMHNFTELSDIGIGDLDREEYFKYLLLNYVVDVPIYVE